MLLVSARGAVKCGDFALKAGLVDCLDRANKVFVPVDLSCCLIWQGKVLSFWVSPNSLIVGIRLSRLVRHGDMISECLEVSGSVDLCSLRVILRCLTEVPSVLCLHLGLTRKKGSLSRCSTFKKSSLKSVLTLIELDSKVEFVEDRNSLLEVTEDGVEDPNLQNFRLVMCLVLMWMLSTVLTSDDFDNDLETLLEAIVAVGLRDLCSNLSGELLS